MSEIWQFVETKNILLTTSLCHPHGMMACPGATFLQHYDSRVIPREYNLYALVIACQVCAREYWNTG